MYRVTGTLAAVMLMAAAPATAQTAAIVASQAHHDAARKPHRNTVTFSGTVSDYSEAASEQQYDLKVARKISMRTTLFGAITQHNNFDILDAQVQAGVTHAISRRAMVTASVTQGIGADVVAGHAVDLKLAGEVSPRLRPFLEYNFSAYKETTKPGFPPAGIDEQTITIGAEVPFDAKTSISGAYQYSDASDREGAHGGTAFLTHQATPRLAVHAGGSFAGAERLIVVSKYAFLRHAETAGASAGFSWTVSDRAGIDFTYEFSRVRGYENIHKFSPVLTWSF